MRSNRPVDLQPLRPSAPVSGDGVGGSGDRPVFPAACVETVDEGLDGTTNWQLVRLFDAAGNVRQWELDSNGDGQVDYRERYAYSTEGLIETVVVEHASGQQDLRTFFYDADNRIRFYDTDHGRDGSVNGRETWTYTEAGEISTQTYDHLGDEWPVNHRYTYRYNERGHIVQRDLDRLGDGVIEERVDFVVDDTGREMEARWDAPGGDVPIDGVPNRIERFAYDASGNKVAREVDGNADGTADGAGSYSYLCFE